MSPPSPTMSETRAEIRKSNKPLMEKRRRARINASLTQLKSLVLEAMKKDTSRYSKLEKADILDMTVKHLKSLHRQQMSAAIATDPSIVSKYRAGFNECAKEVTRYLNSVAGIEPEVKVRLISHLANSVQQQNSQPQQQSMHHQSMQPLRIQIPPMAQLQMQQRDVMHPAATVVSSTSAYTVPSQDLSKMAVQLIPGTLPTGEVAFFVPQGHGQGQTNSAQGQIPPMAHSGAAPVSLATAPYGRRSHVVQTPPAGSEPPSTSSSPDSMRSSPSNVFSDIHGSPLNLHRYPQNASAVPAIAVKQEGPVWRPW